MDFGVGQREPEIGAKRTVPKNAPRGGASSPRSLGQAAELIIRARSRTAMWFPDLKGGLPGRGLWVKAEAGTVARRLRNAFARRRKARPKRRKTWRIRWLSC